MLVGWFVGWFVHWFVDWFLGQEGKGRKLHFNAPKGTLVLYLYLCVRVLDVFLLQGVDTLFQVSLALLMMARKELLTQVTFLVVPGVCFIKQAQP